MLVSFAIASLSYIDAHASACSASKFMTEYALQELACIEMKEKEAMANLTRINLTLSHSLTQALETILVLSKQLHALKDQAKSKTPTTEIPVMEKKTRDTKSKYY